MAAAGICAGLSAWALAATFGLSAILAASNLLYQLLKAAGAVYLCWLGVRIIRQSMKKGPVEKSPEFLSKTPLRWFSVGLWGPSTREGWRNEGREQ